MDKNAEHSPADHGKIDEAQLLLIVVGAHLRAEAADRPLAYRLGQKIENWLERHAQEMSISLVPLVCTDVWYINHQALQKRPTISLGGPGVNALSAYFAHKLPSAWVRDDHMVIQLDAEYVDLRVCLWGMNHKLTVGVLDLFYTRYLDGYLRAVATQVEPQMG